LQQREQTAAAVRTLTSDNAVKTKRKFEEWKQAEQRKKNEVDESFLKNESTFQNMREDQRKQHLLQSVEARFKAGRKRCECKVSRELQKEKNKADAREARKR
jgi:hypothetical protein